MPRGDWLPAPPLLDPVSPVFRLAVWEPDFDDDSWDYEPNHYVGGVFLGSTLVFRSPRAGWSREVAVEYVMEDFGAALARLLGTEQE